MSQEILLTFDQVVAQTDLSSAARDFCREAFEKLNSQEQNRFLELASSNPLWVSDFLSVQEKKYMAAELHDKELWQMAIKDEESLFQSAQ